MTVISIPDVVVAKPIHVDLEPASVQVDVGDERKRSVRSIIPTTATLNSHICHYHESKMAVFYAGLKSPPIPLTNKTIIFLKIPTSFTLPISVNIRTPKQQVILLATVRSVSLTYYC